jgi:hypothetical protein
MSGVVKLKVIFIAILKAMIINATFDWSYLIVLILPNADWFEAEYLFI